MYKLLGFTGILLFGVGLLSAQAQETPRIEISGEYSYVRANQITSDGCCFQMNGANGSVGWTLNRSAALVTEVGGYRSGNVNSTGRDLNVITYLFGPRVTVRGRSRLKPFAEVLIGGGHASGGLYSDSSSSGGGSQNGFAMASGGGLDARLTRYVAVRLIQADYLLTRFKNGSNDHQNSLRLSGGLVFELGKR